MNTDNSSVVTHEMLRRMEDKILKNKPQLREIKNMYGELSYFEYAKRKNRINPNKNFSDRKTQLIEVVTNQVTRLLGSEVASEVERQLKKNDSVSTAEHTAPIGTAPTLGAGLSASVPMFGNSDPKNRNIIIFSCSGASYNNLLSFSRGFQFHTFHNQQVLNEQITFFGRAVDPKAILYSAPYTIDSIEEVKKNLLLLKNEGKLGEIEKEKIGELLDHVYASPHALTGIDYADQLTITNFFFWKKLFPLFSKSDVPNYVMLSQEKIALDLILNYHIGGDTPIHRFLFDRKYNALTEKYFDGITAAFKNDKSVGTFLFWGLSKNDKSRFQLFREGNKLVSKDGLVHFDLTPESIQEAIKNQEIFPGVLLTFVILSFYYGLSLGGGASQPTYLTHMKKAYIDMMQELGDGQSALEVQETVTDDFVFYRPHLAFIDAYGERISATGLDMYLYQSPNGWKNILNATKTISMNEFIEILLPILYKQFCPEEEREEELMNISRQDVERFTGFDKKLPVLGTIA